MADPLPDPATLSEAITKDIHVKVVLRYGLPRSRPLEDEWIFAYTVRITNQSPETVQLVSRHWIIADGFNRTREVKGPGAVGEQPVLAPGESFKYASWCPLATPTGDMRGAYQMSSAGGNRFDIEIAPFGLKASYQVN